MVSWETKTNNNLKTGIMMKIKKLIYVLQVLYGIDYIEYYFYWIYYKFIGYPLIYFNLSAISSSGSAFGSSEMAFISS